MKKTVAFILALLMLALVLCACADKGGGETQGSEETPDVGADGLELNGKTPKEVYDEARAMLASLEKFEYSEELTTLIYFLPEEPFEEKSVTQYRTDGTNVEYITPSQSLIYVGGTLYSRTPGASGSEVLTRKEVSREEFLQGFTFSIKNILPSLDEEDFLGLTFEQDGELYFLNFRFSEDKFFSVTGQPSSGGQYSVGFKSDGSLAEIRQQFTSHSGYDYAQISKYDIKSKSDVVISAPENADSYNKE